MVERKEIELDEYERWVESELEKGNFVPVENFEEWKALIERAAEEKLKELKGMKKNRVMLEFSSPDLKEKAIKLLKEQFGEGLKVVHDI